MADTADAPVLGMDRLDHVVEHLAHQRRQAQHVGGGHRLQARKVLLRIEDGVEVAAVGDVEAQLSDSGNGDAHVGRRQVRGDIGDAHALDEAALLLVARHHPPGRRVEVEHARRRGRHQPVLDRHGHRPDRAVAAHRQTARDLDEQDRRVAIGAGRRIEDGARHHVVTARLEHQRPADPVVMGEEVEPPLAHGRAFELRTALLHEPHRIAASVAVEAGESVGRHGAGS